jgi:hypothetical protein
MILLWFFTLRGGFGFSGGIASENFRRSLVLASIAVVFTRRMRKPAYFSPGLRAEVAIADTAFDADHLRQAIACHSACNIGSDSLLMQFEGCLAL